MAATLDPVPDTTRYALLWCVWRLCWGLRGTIGAGARMLPLAMQPLTDWANETRCRRSTTLVVSG